MRRMESVVAVSMRSTAVATSISSGWASHGGDGVSSASEPRNWPTSGLMYQLSSKSMTIGIGPRCESCRRIEGEGGAPLGHQADRFGAGQSRDDIGPGARGIDDVGGGEFAAVAQADPPQVVATLEVDDLGIEAQVGAVGARALQEAAMDRCDVHVVGLGLEDRAAGGRLGPEQRLAAQHLGGLQPAHARYQPGELAGVLLHLGLLLGAARDQGAAWRQQGMVGEACGRLAIEAARGHGDGADLLAAVGLRMQRRRPAGRVIGGDVLAFENDDACPASEVVGGGDPGDAGADDGEIEILHGRHIARSSDGLQ